jgi:hypothetical protein
MKIEKWSFWERRPFAPRYCFQIGQIIAGGKKVAVMTNYTGYKKKVVSRLELAKYFQQEQKQEVEPEPKRQFLKKARWILRRQLISYRRIGIL